MTGKSATTETLVLQQNQQPQNIFRSSISDSLEQLASASQRLADLAASVVGIVTPVNPPPKDAPIDEVVQQAVGEIFRAEKIEGYNGSETMEEARVAHLNAALEMYRVMAEDIEPSENIELRHNLAVRIGVALSKELLQFYRVTQSANKRTIFTTEQRTALESAFLLKPKLNTAEKRALATACNLNPRQVEVWVRAQSSF